MRGLAPKDLHRGDAGRSGVDRVEGGDPHRRRGLGGDAVLLLGGGGIVGGVGESLCRSLIEVPESHGGGRAKDLQVCLRYRIGDLVVHSSWKGQGRSPYGPPVIQARLMPS